MGYSAHYLPRSPPQLLSSQGLQQRWNHYSGTPPSLFSFFFLVFIIYLSICIYFLYRLHNWKICTRYLNVVRFVGSSMYFSSPHQLHSSLITPPSSAPLSFPLHPTHHPFVSKRNKGEEGISCTSIFVADMISFSALLSPKGSLAAKKRKLLHIVGCCYNKEIIIQHSPFGCCGAGPSSRIGMSPCLYFFLFVDFC